jgi:hypothetical protein
MQLPQPGVVVHAGTGILVGFLLHFGLMDKFRLLFSTETVDI